MIQPQRGVQVDLEMHLVSQSACIVVFKYKYTYIYNYVNAKCRNKNFAHCMHILLKHFTPSASTPERPKIKTKTHHIVTMVAQTNITVLIIYYNYCQHYTLITVFHKIFHYLRILEVSASVFLTEIVKLSSHPQVFDSVLLSSHSSLYYKMNMYSSMLVWIASKSSINTTQIKYLKSFDVCLIQSQV